MKIAVAGAGYVGLSMATLLSQRHSVTVVDVVPEKVSMVNKRQSPIQDDYIEEFFLKRNLDLRASSDAESAYRDAEYVIVATPTNYDPKKNFFDTSAVDAVVDLVSSVNPSAYIVIKSTIPVGYTVALRERTGNKRILFSPEFLRESQALYDNLYPSRIVVGTDMEDRRLMEAAERFADILKELNDRIGFLIDVGLGYLSLSGQAFC